MSNHSIIMNNHEIIQLLREFMALVADEYGDLNPLGSGEPFASLQAPLLERARATVESLGKHPNFEAWPPAGTSWEWLIHEEGTGITVAGGSAPTENQALQEANHYLSLYCQDGPHYAELRVSTPYLVWHKSNPFERANRQFIAEEAAKRRPEQA